MSRASAFGVGGVATALTGALVALSTLGSDLFDRVSMQALYSRGVIVPLFSAYLLWQMRGTFRGARPEWSRVGGLLVVAGLALLGIAVAVASRTVASIGIPSFAGGVAALGLGRARARALAFPIALLALMAPIPRAILPPLSSALQYAAAVVTQAELQLLTVPSSREGTLIHLPYVTIDINETCNGLSFLMAMIVIGVVAGWRTQTTLGRGLAVVGLAIVVGLIANWIRITATTLIAFAWGRDAATGLAHTVLGESVYLMMVTVFMLFVSAGGRRGGTVTAEPAPPGSVAERPA